MDESTKNLLKSAQAGKSWAQYNLGLRYSKGKGVEQDYVQAVYWYRKAAQQGDPDAQINLGFRYAHGEGVEKDDVEAVRWYNKAAQQGHPRGQFNLGFRYAKGRGIEQDDVEAVRWYNKAAQQGHASAQSNLGLMYEKGKGVDQDYVEAVKWYRKAANQGHLRGQYNLADMYEQGKGVAKDLAVAWELYQSAKSEIESADKATERLKDDEACLEARKKVRHVLIHRRDDESKWQALLRDKEESGVTHPLNSYMNQNESRSNTSKDSKDSTNSKDSKDSKDSTIHSTSHSKSAHVKQVAGTAEDINQIKREMQKEYEKKLQYSKQQQRRFYLASVAVLITLAISWFYFYQPTHFSPEYQSKLAKIKSEFALKEKKAIKRAQQQAKRRAKKAEEKALKSEVSRLKRLSEAQLAQEIKRIKASTSDHMTVHGQMGSREQFILSLLGLMVAFLLERIFERVFKNKGYALLTVCLCGALVAFFTANYFLMGSIMGGGVMGGAAGSTSH